MKKDYGIVLEFRQENNKRLDNWVKTHLFGFLMKNKDKKDHNEITHILDFLNSKEAPKRITRMGYVEAKIAAHKWVAKLNKNFVEDEIIEHDIHTVRKYPNGYNWVKLQTHEAYKREGSKMGHCVADYYGKETQIYSLRDELNLPHCTVEIRDHHLYKEISQLRGKQNKAPVIKYIPYIRDMFLVSVGGTWIERDYKINEHELKNLYLYNNEGEILDLFSLPSVVTFKKTLSNYEMRDISIGLESCQKVTFNEHVTMTIETFSKRKNWIFKKGVSLIGDESDSEFELDLQGISLINIEDDENVKTNFLLLKNINADICQLKGSNFRFMNQPKIQVLELDSKILDINNFSLELKILNMWKQSMVINCSSATIEKLTNNSLGKTTYGLKDVYDLLL